MSVFDTHCGRRGCNCTHAYGCVRGWVDMTDEHGDAITTPCGRCRPELARRVASIPPPGRRTERDLAILRAREDT